MTTDTALPFDLPEDISASARDAAVEILTARPDLKGAEVAALSEALYLVTLADDLTAVSKDVGYLSTGDRGQSTVHKAVTEARLARTAAAAIFSHLVPSEETEAASASAAGRALVAKRRTR